MPTEYYFYIFIAGFAAGFLDAIVGGGGLILTPAMSNLFPSFEMLNIIATNRTSSIFGTSVAAKNYLNEVKIDKKIIFYAAFSALIMGIIGAKAATLVHPKTLKIMVLVTIVAISIYTYFMKKFGETEQLKYASHQLPKVAAIIGASCGFYNGFVGPGTGTLLVFAFVSVIGYNFLKASAISKVTNVAGDIGSWTILAYKGYIFWEAALPLVVSNVLGSYFGSKMAILKGNQFIKTIFTIVVLALIIKALYGVFTF